jgi:hypothetical protein
MTASPDAPLRRPVFTIAMTAAVGDTGYVKMHVRVIHVRRNLPETRRDLLAHQLQRTHNLFSGKETAAIELSQDAIETQAAGQIADPGVPTITLSRSASS